MAAAWVGLLYPPEWTRETQAPASSQASRLGLGAFKKAAPAWIVLSCPAPSEGEGGVQALSILFCGVLSSSQYMCLMLAFQVLAGELGVPLAEEKMERPSEVLTFLGIELDTI